MPIPAPDVRVDRLERRADMLNENDRALADKLDELRVGQRQHTLVLDRHSTTLAEHTTLLQAHSSTLAEHTTLLQAHSSTLAEHTTLLHEHSSTLAKHTDLLEDQSATLERHTLLLGDLTTQVELLRFNMTTVTRSLRDVTKFHADHNRKLENHGQQLAGLADFVTRQEAFNAATESKLATVMTDVTDIKGTLAVILSRLPE